MGCCPSATSGEEEPARNSRDGYGAIPTDPGAGENHSGKERRHRQKSQGAREDQIEQIKRRMQEGRVAATPEGAARQSAPTGSSGAKERYELHKKLGEGAFGLVRKAIDRRTGTEVAIKMVSRQQLALGGEGAEERLEREIAILHLMSHPNIVNLREILASEETNEMWIVLEFVDGSDLMQVIQHRRRLGEDDARRYFQQMLVGLNYVHSQNVAHRDLKPDNVMVTHDHRVKITDFGLSNFQRTDEYGEVVRGLSLKTCCGTPYYVAPEVISSSSRRGYSGFTCDVWSLGIILFAMLLGDLPFVGRDLAQLLERIRQGRFTFPKEPQLSSDCRGAISAVLTADPQLRPTLRQIGQHAWVSPGFDMRLLDVAKIDVSTAGADVVTSLRRTIRSLRAADAAEIRPP